MFPAVKEEGGGHEREREAITVAGEGIFRNIVAALLTMREIGKRSSTYSHFSLSPLILPNSDLIQSIQLQYSPIRTHCLIKCKSIKIIKSPQACKCLDTFWVFYFYFLFLFIIYYLFFGVGGLGVFL